jgi:hypothetical protein
MYEPNPNEYTEDELNAALDELFPQGFAGSDVFKEICPEGWANSPWAGAVRREPDEMAKEMSASLRAMENWKPGDPMPTFPSMDDLSRRMKELAEKPLPEPVPADPVEVVREMVGRCLWDIFSDNHDVTDSEGRRLHLGSHRGSAGFLAQYLNRGEATDQYFYLDFYMGNTMADEKATLAPVYEMVFRRLKGKGYDWKYSFPRLHLVDFRPLKEAMEREKNPEGEYAEYDPSAEFEKSEEDRRKDEELAAMRAKLDEGYRESVEAAREQPPPATVQAYEAIYGEFPAGWPPELDD